MKNLLKLLDLSTEEIIGILDLADQLKYERKHNIPHELLKGQTLGMIFQKSSTRTRVSFETGMYQLGGHALFLSSKDLQIGRGEPVQDTARVLSRYLDGIMIRTFEQKEVENLAKFGSIPVINGLTNDSHPCQVMGDIMSFIEKRGSIKGAVVTWIGDANNVLYSWLYSASILGFKVHISAPPGYSINPTQVPDNDDCYDFFLSPEEAAEGADLVTTDNWRSCGYDENQAKRQSKSARWQVNETVMKAAKPDALFMHCLPAFRGQEVSSEVIDGPQSVVWDEAENRLHFQKALMEYLLLGRIEDV